jgi:hypothetical protein
MPAKIAAISLIVSLAGCSSQPQCPPFAESTQIAGPAVQRQPFYRIARTCFQHGDRSGAWRALKRIPVAGLDTPSRTFLEQQKALCQPKRRIVSSRDCGPRTLALICEKLGISVDPSTLSRRAGVRTQGTSLSDLARVARLVGLQPHGIQVDRTALTAVHTPAIAWIDAHHFVAVLQIDGTTAPPASVAHVRDPDATAVQLWSLDELLARSGGVLMTLTRGAHNAFR